MAGDGGVAPGLSAAMGDNCKYLFQKIKSTLVTSALAFFTSRNFAHVSAIIYTLFIALLHGRENFLRRPIFADTNVSEEAACCSAIFSKCACVSLHSLTGC